MNKYNKSWRQVNKKTLVMYYCGTVKKLREELKRLVKHENTKATLIAVCMITPLIGLRVLQNLI